MDLVIKTGKIDMFGALGRDFHPKKDDEGIFLKVERMDTEKWDCCDGCDENGGINPNCEFCGGTGTMDVRIFTGKTAIGRVLEIMDYEVSQLAMVYRFKVQGE